MDKKLPFYDYHYLMQELAGYASPKSKLTQLIKSGEVIRVRRGLYIDGRRDHWPLRLLANRIYGPSYLSFEYAMAFYGLIPERPYIYTSACYGKNRNKEFVTPVGTYTYQDVPRRVYPLGVQRVVQGEDVFLIAGPEKALADFLARMHQRLDILELPGFLAEDLRIDLDLLCKLDIQLLTDIAKVYRRPIVSLLVTYLGGSSNE